jgi:murein DD-endopeptidase MepM/ murein hydrolase activator NlpD
MLLLAAPAAAQSIPGNLPPPVRPACISSPFGPRRLVGPRAATFHRGIDLPAPAGGWVYAVLPGRVVELRRKGSAGLEVTLQHGDARQGEFITRYAHLGTVTPALANGRAEVKAGEVLGRVGRTGVTYGTHLYFEIRVRGQPIDPEPYFSVPRCGR